MSTFYALVALCLSGSALAQVPSHGPCPSVKAQSDFEITKFVGTWYEAQRFYTNYELGGKCNKVIYSLGKNNTIRRVDSDISTLTGKVRSYKSRVLVADPVHNPGKGLIHYPLTPDGVLSNKWSLGTDYHNYAVVYGCNEYGKLNLKYAWIWTRKRHPKNSDLTKAYEIINKNKIDKSNFFETDQEGCYDEDSDKE